MKDSSVRRATIVVRQRAIIAEVDWVDGRGRRCLQVRSFTTAAADLASLRAWLERQGVARIAVHLLDAQNGIPEGATVARARPGRVADLHSATEELFDLFRRGTLRRSGIPAPSDEPPACLAADNP